MYLQQRIIWKEVTLHDFTIIKIIARIEKNSNEIASDVDDKIKLIIGIKAYNNTL